MGLISSVTHKTWDEYTFGIANALTPPLLEEKMQKILHATKSYQIYDGFCTVASKKDLEEEERLESMPL